MLVPKIFQSKIDLMDHRRLPILIVCGWCGLLILLVWHVASGAGEPPVWDSMSYFQKAQGFWEAFARDGYFNPFEIQPTTRPPGTILVTYPFGFNPDFRGFYFRTVAIPLALLAVAAVIAFDLKDQPAPSHWMRASLALTVVGLPLLYHFQINDTSINVDTWGRVDGFLTALAAVATASIMRSVSRSSIIWAVFGALTAALCFTVKPSGLIIMALVGVIWLGLLFERAGWRLQPLHNNPVTRRYVACSFFAAIAIYAVTIIAAYTSAYFSSENLAYGRQAINIMKSELPTWVGLNTLIKMVYASVGVLIPAVIFSGIFICAQKRSFLGHLVATLTCLFGGVWFVLYTNGTTEVRYIVPFLVMAFLISGNVLLRVAIGWPRLWRATFLLFPTFLLTMTTILLAADEPAFKYQELAGISITGNAYKSERAQMSALLSEIRAENSSRKKIYLSNVSSPFRNMIATAQYESTINKDAPSVILSGPIDWQRPHGFQIDEILGSDFFIFEPITDASERDRILARRQVLDFSAETLLLSAWATTLNESNGVKIQSETQLRILKIIDRAALEKAFLDLVQRHDWPASFLQNNQRRWWSLNELQAHLGQSGAALLNAAYRPSTPNGPSLTVRGATSGFKGTMFDVDIWVEGNAPQTWVLFAHIINQNGEILRNAQANIANAEAQSSDSPIRRYTLTYPDIPPQATSLAVGFFLPKDNDIEFLLTTFDHVDWDGRRLILPLNKGESAN